MPLVHPMLRMLIHRGPCNPRVWLVVLVASLALLATAPGLLGSSGPHGQSHPAEGAATGGDAGHTVIERLSPNLAELPLTGKILIIVLQLSLVLALAKLLGWAAEAVKIPGVLGELAAGMIIGPFALGQFIKVYAHTEQHGQWFPLFPPPAEPTEWPMSSTLWAVAVIASIVLLFGAGLHTNLQQFFRNLPPATV